MAYWLLIIYILLPAYQIRFKIFGLPTTLLEMMILALFVVYLVRNYERVTKIQKLSSVRSWFWPISAWLIVGLIAVFVSPDKIGALGHWRAYFLEPILLLIIFFDLAKRDARVTNLVLVGLAISAIYSSLWAILQKWSLLHLIGFGGQVGGGVMSTEIWGAPKIWRATGPFPQPNFLGLYLGPIVILALGQLFASCGLRIKSFKKLLAISFWSLVIILGFVAIILARSEGAILGVVAGLIFFGLLNQKSRYWTAVGLVILILLIFFLPVARNYIIPKITFQDLSGQLRLNIWRGASELIKDHPIFGVGLRGYQKLIPRYQKPYYSPTTNQLISVETHPYPHNLFLTIWAELGILGLIVFLWILFKFFRIATKYEFVTNIRIYSLISAMLTLLVHGLVDTPYFKNDLAVLFWLIVGLMVVESRQISANL